MATKSDNIKKDEQFVIKNEQIECAGFTVDPSAGGGSPISHMPEEDGDVPRDSLGRIMVEGQGQAPHIVTDSKKKTVADLTAFQHSIEQIAEYMQVHRTTVIRHYSHELRTATANLVSKAGGVLMQKLNEGNLPAAMFVLKCRGRWRETDKVEPGVTRESLESMRDQLDKLLEEKEHTFDH